MFLELPTIRFTPLGLLSIQNITGKIAILAICRQYPLFISLSEFLLRYFPSFYSFSFFEPYFMCRVART